MAPSVPPRKYDLVVLGATGFTGRLAAEYLVNRYGPSSPRPVRFALAGRSRAKLETIRELTGAPEDCLVECDVTDAVQVDALVAQAAAVANYAGTPFIDKALPVVAACARHGTHYVDITGEVPLHRASYDEHHEACERSGAVVLHGCGFDSVPSDLAAFLAARAVRERHGTGCRSVRGYMSDFSGGLSGGTLSTIFSLLDPGAKKMPGAAAAAAKGAYALDPPSGHGGPDKGSFGHALPLAYDARAKLWCIPFLMAETNAVVVRKSNALLGYAYGDATSYTEVQAFTSFPGAALYLAGLAAAGVIVAFAALLPPVRSALYAVGLLPRAGDGPTKEQREKGSFALRALAVAEDGEKTAAAYVRSGTAGDPGYKATALMSVESALCLALERGRCAPAGGVLTPAVALGDVLVERLTAAGMEVGVEPASNGK